MEEKKKIIFISGPITGVEKYWEAFDEFETYLTSKGYTVLNPANLPQGMRAQNYTNICWMMLTQADAVLFLPGWEDSMGAAGEHSLAALLKKPIYYDVYDLCGEVPTK